MLSQITFLEDGTTLEGERKHRQLLINQSLAVHTFFFRNLTSFDVSACSNLDDCFVVALFGPLGSSRANIVRVSLRRQSDWCLLAYLLEAFNRLSWTAETETYEVTSVNVPAGDGDTGFFESLKERWTDEEPNLDAEEEEKLDEIAKRLAPSNYLIFRTMVIPSFVAVDCLRGALVTRHIACQPFLHLQNLTVELAFPFELYLIFYSRLFPSLRLLKLIGEVVITILVDHDIKLLRHAITE